MTEPIPEKYANPAPPSGEDEPKEVGPVADDNDKELDAVLQEGDEADA